MRGSMPAESGEESARESDAVADSGWRPQSSGRLLSARERQGILSKDTIQERLDLV